ncbi:MAG: agmatine deiminase family protein [Pseudomonadota bacterium]
MSVLMFYTEWAVSRAVMLAWPDEETDWVHNDLKLVQEDYLSIIKSLSDYITPWIICRTAQHRDYIIQRMQEAGDLKHSLYISLCAYDDTWIRDYGPLTRYGTNTCELNDFEFNAWGDKYSASDDRLLVKRLWESGEFERVLGSDFKLEYRAHDWVLEGGSIDVSTDGVLITTKNCLLNSNRTGWNAERIEEHLRHDLGVHQVLWLNHGHLIGDDTDAHVDTIVRWGRDREIIIQGGSPSSDRQNESLEKLHQEILAFKEQGLISTIWQLPLPKAVYEGKRRLPASYANFLVTPRALFVPTYQCEQDLQALEILHHAFPEHHIVAVPGKELVRQNGSLHCATMQV